MMTSGHAMDDEAVVAGGLPDPVGLGWNAADFDIGEPHNRSDLDGDVDELGVHWAGNLTNGVPPRR
jgi:hypothetical protein